MKIVEDSSRKPTLAYANTCDMPQGMVFKVGKGEAGKDIWGAGKRYANDAATTSDICSGTFIKGQGKQFVRLDESQAGPGTSYTGNITFPTDRIVTFYPDAQLVLGSGMK